MSFWSSQTLEARLATLIAPPPRDHNVIDCNAITLHIGREFYVTRSSETGTPDSHTKVQLAEGQAFAIPPGQFAFVQTEESVRVPDNAMAFISMKARTKFRGLVNVSGFHVDPGWDGPLIFAVFNAGPSMVHLERGMPLFLIWYADLDFPSARRKDKPGPTNIPPELINNISGELNSFNTLDRRITDETTTLDGRITEETAKLSDRIHTVELSQTRINVSAGILLGILGSLVTGLLLYAAHGLIGEAWHSVMPGTHTSQSALSSPTPQSAAAVPENTLRPSGRPANPEQQKQQAAGKPKG